MYEVILKNAGLSDAQAEVYGFLLGQKAIKASEIAKNTKRPRGVVYKALDDLFLLGLVEKIENKGIARFRAENPTSLEKVLEIKEKRAKQELEAKSLRLEREKEQVLAGLPELQALFNTTKTKPAIRYYDGEEGIIEALAYLGNKLEPNTEIISFTKVLPEGKAELNTALQQFVFKRREKQVKTRVVSIKNEEGELLKASDYSNLRETKLATLKNLALDFPGGEIFVYSDELYVMTTDNSRHFALVIQSRSMAQLFKAFFEAEWSLLSS
ncbi:MAG: helix-turn-helix domain-containing protein [Candidatus Falkowbacteria bacterium]